MTGSFSKFQDNIYSLSEFTPSYYYSVLRFFNFVESYHHVFNPRSQDLLSVPSTTITKISLPYKVQVFRRIVQ